MSLLGVARGGGDAPTDRMLRADGVSPFHGHGSIEALAERIRQAYLRQDVVVNRVSVHGERGLDSLVPGSVVLDYNGELWSRDLSLVWVTDKKTSFGFAGAPALPALIVIDGFKEWNVRWLRR